MLTRFDVVAPWIVAMLVWFSPAAAQCPGEWRTGPSQGFPGIDGSVAGMIEWDPDGDGPRPSMIVICGVFTTAGDKTVSNLVGWDGSEWHDFGAPAIDGRVRKLGIFRGSLVIGGDFQNVGSVSTKRVARFDGTAWHSMNFDAPAAFWAPWLVDLAEFQDRLYVSVFRNDGGPSVWAWDGAQWTAQPSHIRGTELTVHAGELVASRIWSSTSSVVTHVLRQNAWVPWPSVVDIKLTSTGTRLLGIPTGGTRQVRDAATQQVLGNFNDWVYEIQAIGDRVYAMGTFTAVNGISAPGLAVWDGTTWSAVTGAVPGEVQCLAKLRGTLYAGGAFTNPVGGLVNLESDSWVAPSVGLDGTVKAFATFNGDLAMAGYFVHAGDEPAAGIAAWNGASLEPIGTGFDGDTLALAEHGGKLVAGGRFMNTRATTPRVAERLAQWDGTQWWQFDPGIDGEVRALASYQGRLYVGGAFETLGGDQRRNPTPCLNIARSAPLPSQRGLLQVGAGFNGSVRALHVHGDELYAGGEFTMSGVTPVSRVARWDGAAWRTVSAGFDRPVFALTTYRGKLVAGGAFTSTFLRTANRVAILDDSGQWMPMGAGLNFIVTSLREYKGDLFAGGYFQNSGGVPMFNIARWNGQAWLPLGGVAGGGTDTEVSALAVFHDELILGGDFTEADGAISAYWARFHSQPCCPGDLNEDGMVNDEDFVTFAEAYGRFDCPNRPCPADLNGDGFVDDQDFVYFTQVYQSAECL